MHLTLCQQNSKPLLLLAEQEPGDLLLVAERWAALIGLPSRPETRMAAWFRRMAASFGTEPGCTHASRDWHGYPCSGGPRRLDNSSRGRRPGQRGRRLRRCQCWHMRHPGGQAD